MAPLIHNMNEGSWETLVLSILKPGLIKTDGVSLHLIKQLVDINRIILLFSIRWMRSYFKRKQISAEDESHENIILKLIRTIYMRFIILVLMKIKKIHNDVSVRLKVI